MKAQLVYVHFKGDDDTAVRHMNLFQMHLEGGPLEGNIIPCQYKVHASALDLERKSVNLTMTNGGGPVDTETLTKHFSRFPLFGIVEVREYGTIDIL